MVGSISNSQWNVPVGPFGISSRRNSNIDPDPMETIIEENGQEEETFFFSGRDPQGRVNNIAHPILNNGNIGNNGSADGPPEAKRFTFLFDRFKSLRFSLGEEPDIFTFKLEDFIMNPTIRQRIVKEIQKLLVEKIDRISRSILDDIRNAGSNMNIEAAQKIVTKCSDVKLWSRCFKLLKDFGEITQNENKMVKDAEAIVTLFAKITNLASKWQRGELTINLQDLLTYDSFNSFLEATYDTISGIKDSVEVLDKNTFIQMAYAALGFGEKFTPFTDGVMEFLDTVDIFLTPIKIILKGSKFIITGKEWLYYDPKNSNQDLNEVRMNAFKATLDVTKEGIKVAMIGLVYFGVVASAPFTVTATIAVLSMTSLSVGVIQQFTKPDEPQEAVAAAAA